MSIHPTAIISPKARVDPSAEVGPYVIIEDEVTIGPGCRIAPHVYINGNTTIGANNEIHTGVVLGDTPQDRAYEPCRSFLEIGDNNIIREFCSIHRGTAAESTTRIGSGCFIMGYAHIAHNCEIGDRVTIANAAALAGHVRVGAGAFVSARVTVHQFVRIGRLCMISGSSRVPMDVPPFLTLVERGEVIGVNVVGLRRAGFSSDEISQVRSAYRALYRSGLLFGEATDKLARENAHPLVNEMIEFVRSPSKRGISGPPKRRRRGGEEPVESAEEI